MIQTAVQAGNDQRINFFNVFGGIKKITIGRNILDLFSPKVKVKSDILNWFEKSPVLIPLALTTVPASTLSKDHVTIKFKMSDAYREHFVLFRGLLAFNHVKEISIASNTSERTFETNVDNDQATTVTAHLDTITDLLNKELSFKKSLRTLLKFEEAMKKQQSKLYQALKASLH
jgi:hypothetical protein